MKWRNSLLVKYLLIVLLAMMIWPLIFPLAAIVYNLPRFLSHSEASEPNPYANGNQLEKMWHTEAEKLAGANGSEVDERLRQLREQYTSAAMFWVDGTGKTRLSLPERSDLPAAWNFSDSIAFMKKSYDSDPFTVVAFVGQDPSGGFMVLQVPRSLMIKDSDIFSNRYFIIIILAFFTLFLAISWLFFYRIRGRLVRLEKAMAIRDGAGIPFPVTIRKKDEIGQLEVAFNRMIGQLTTGRAREQEEEALRKQLIANLSHDLRTPLTIIRSHAYSLKKEPLSVKGKESLALMEAKSDDLNRLIENLLSYTLLSAGKYPIEPVQTDVLRLVRSAAAGWYPLFEEEGFEVDVQLPDRPLNWRIDPHWFTRILDNLLQNVVRHAKTGRYIGIRTEERAGETALVIVDKGPGTRALSAEKGAGIGLNIVGLMVKEMNLRMEMESSPTGTSIYLYPSSGPRPFRREILNEI